jgi:hypothetical protein
LVGPWPPTLVRAALLLVATTVVTAACTGTPAGVETASARLWPPGASGEEVKAAVATFIDGYRGQPFPSIPVRPADGSAMTTIRDWSHGRKVLLVAYGAGCPYADEDVRFLRDRQWKVSGYDAVAILVHKEALLFRRDRWQHGDPVFITPRPMPSWLDRLHVTPVTFMLDERGVLVDWTWHPKGADADLPTGE